MAQTYTICQEESNVLEKVISSIVNDDGRSFSSDDLGMIKHIISPEDFEILRGNFAVIRNSSSVPFSTMMWHDELMWSCWISEASIIDETETDLLPLEFNYEVLMGVTESIFHHALLKCKSAFQEDSYVLNEKIDENLRPTGGLDELDSNIQRTVYELYWEMTSRCACGVDDAHEVTLALLNSVRDYSFIAQVVLVVAAFAMSFGEFCMSILEPLAIEDHLSWSLCLLKRPLCLLHVTDSMKSGLQSLRTLVERIRDSTKWLVNFNDCGHPLPEVYLIGYQVVYSVVTCLFHNIALVRMDKEYTTSATEVQQMRDSSERLAYLHSYAYARRMNYGRRRQKRHTTPQLKYEDIAKFMSRSISQTGKLVLSHHSTGKATLKEFKRMCSAVFISDFKVQKEEFSSLIKTYKALNDPDTCFGVIWVPMADQSTTWTRENKNIVSSKGNSMPWHWVSDPSTIRSSFLKDVKEKWHFEGNPILVILDSKGQVTHTNALPMIEFWGPSAFPFTATIENHMQKGLSDAIDSLFSANNEPIMEKWVEGGTIDLSCSFYKPIMERRIEEGKIICFYGSHNEEWIRQFLQNIELIVDETNFEMVITYVGTTKKQEELPRILTFIKDISKTRVWSEEKIQSFWHTLKMSTSPNKMNVQFPTRIEFISILSYDETEDGWALIFDDSKQELFKSSGTKLINSLNSFTTRGGSRIHQEPKNFLRELREDLRVKHAAEQCNGVKVPTTRDGPVWEHCIECGRFVY